MVSWNSMISGCAQNRRVEEAFELFTKMPERNLVSWNSMIAAYCQNEQAQKALELFSQMQMGGWMPDQCTFTSVLSACASTAAMEQGMQTHAKIIGCGLVADVLMGSALVDMYAKCGSIEHARYAFDKMHTRNVVSWTMKEAGYLPETDRVPHDVEEELKESIVFHHSEKLAIAFGLLNIPLGKPVRIIKNLRVCSDCHTAIKFICKIAQRQIVVRDASRFHHFQDGLCSCADYWCCKIALTKSTQTSELHLGSK
ncbi:hypothetical protein KI387_020790, partial [Taxus chinensis]